MQSHNGRGSLDCFTPLFVSRHAHAVTSCHVVDVRVFYQSTCLPDCIPYQSSICTIKLKRTLLNWKACRRRHVTSTVAEIVFAISTQFSLRGLAKPSSQTVQKQGHIALLVPKWKEESLLLQHPHKPPRRAFTGGQKYNSIVNSADDFEYIPQSTKLGSRFFVVE